MKVFAAGIGLAGGRVLDGVYSKLGEDRFAGVALLNTSESDAEGLQSLKEKLVLFGDTDQGVGGRWKTAKRMMSSPEVKERVISALKGENIESSSIVLLVAAMGGGTGAGATASVARYIREIFKGKDITPPIIAMGILPFSYPLEPIRLSYNSTMAISDLLNAADSIFFVDNSMLMGRQPKEGSAMETTGALNTKISSFLDVLFHPTTSLGRGMGGALSAQDLKAALALREASICAPCYAGVRAETIEKALSLVVELAMEEGGLVGCDPASAFRAVFVARAPEENISLNGVLDARKFLLSKIAGIDVTGGVALAEAGSSKAEVSLVLVEPDIPRMLKLIELARAYYDLQEELLSANEETTREELQAHLTRLEGHMKDMGNKKERAKELKHALGVGAEV